MAGRDRDPQYEIIDVGGEYDDDDEDLGWRDQWGGFWDTVLDVRDAVIDFVLSPPILLILLTILGLTGAAIFTWLTSGGTGEPAPRAQEIKLGEPNQIAMDWDVPNPPIFTVIPQYDPKNHIISGEIILGDSTEAFSVQAYIKGAPLTVKLALEDGTKLGYFMVHTVYEDEDNNPETPSTSREIIVFVRESNPPDSAAPPAESTPSTTEGS